MSRNARHARSSTSKASGSFSDLSRAGALAAAIVLLSGCAVYGGAGAARISDGTATISSASARVGPEGISARSQRSVHQLRPVF